MNTPTHAQDLEQGGRFAFGENWANFLRTVDEERIQEAERSLKAMLKLESLHGIRFLDAGSGSGLSSLAARRLGATVHSFDYDPQSVASTRELRRRYYPDDGQWVVEEASVLDSEYLDRIGKFDCVYSWGVLHHTGEMWKAIDTLHNSCKQDGLLFIAIYNYMGGASKRWLWIKRAYCSLPAWMKIPFALAIVVPVQVFSFIAHALQGKTALYIDYIANYERRRGMSWWHDQLDWIGGYPYEDAKLEAIFEFLHERGFSLQKLTTNGGGIGCNEFVFKNQVT